MTTRELTPDEQTEALDLLSALNALIPDEIISYQWAFMEYREVLRLMLELRPQITALLAAVDSAQEADE